MFHYPGGVGLGSLMHARWLPCAYVSCLSTLRLHTPLIPIRRSGPPAIWPSCLRARCAGTHPLVHHSCHFGYHASLSPTGRLSGQTWNTPSILPQSAIVVHLHKFSSHTYSSSTRTGCHANQRCHLSWLFVMASIVESEILITRSRYTDVRTSAHKRGPSQPSAYLARGYQPNQYCCTPDWVQDSNDKAAGRSHCLVYIVLYAPMP